MCVVKPQRTRLGKFAAGILLIFLASTSVGLGENNWPVVGGEPGNSRYSSLSQINRANVTNLGVAWAYHTGDASAGSTIECTPIVIDGVMFLTTARCRVVALEAASGYPIRDHAGRSFRPHCCF